MKNIQSSGTIFEGKVIGPYLTNTGKNMTKKFDLESYKKSLTFSDTPLKPDKYIKLNEALQEVTGLPGLPLGHVTQIFGPSDSGKTSLIFHAAAEAQKQDILPVFIITENKVSWDRAEKMGVNLDKTIVINSEYLEDMFKNIDLITRDVTNGTIPHDVMIFVDSIGNTISSDSIKMNKDGSTEVGGAMMKAAKVIRENMRVHSHRINNTRKITSSNTVGLTFVNHSYTKPPMFPGGMATEVPYGGEGIWYGSSLVLKTKKGQKLEAIKNGKKVKFGMVSKIAVDKNHLCDVSNSGEFVIVSNDVLPKDKKAIDEYKNAHKDEWGDSVIDD